MNRLNGFKHKKILKELLYFFALLLLFHLSTQVSFLFQVEPNWTKIYFPTIVGLVLVHWFGPRVIIPSFVNAVFSNWLWDMPQFWLYPVYALPEISLVFLSWFLFSKLKAGKCWIPDLKNLVNFILYGIASPLVVFMIAHELIFLLALGDTYDINQSKIINTLLAEFLAIMSLGLPVLYFFSHRISKVRRSIIYNIKVTRPEIKLKSGSKDIIKIFLLTIILFLLNNFVPFIDYWFVYGILAIIVAVSWKFDYSLIVFLLIFINSYVIYYFNHDSEGYQLLALNSENKFYLQLSLLLIASFFSGRIVADYSLTQIKLTQQNKALKKLNEELDRFVYSVSHDLTAPLKSIDGLVELAKMDKDKKMQHEYLDHIKRSTRKLNEFIKEVLDFSRNSRLVLNVSRVDLRQLLDQIIISHRYDGKTRDLSISMKIDCKFFQTDELRFNIIVSNIISNAYKYQDTSKEFSCLEISTSEADGKLRMTFKDNGIGMDNSTKARVFDLFYRGNERSDGSGLGLYIAKESASRIGGNVSVYSTPGIGSTFILEIPELILS